MSQPLGSLVLARETSASSNASTTSNASASSNASAPSATRISLTSSL